MQCSEDCKTLATAVFKRLPSMRTRSSGLLSTSLTSLEHDARQQTKRAPRLVAHCGARNALTG